ncbi:MAG: YeeE/YedE family protein [Desulfocapsa sp.]|nr:YeeE/YedE family protein [Desulfocapsa sp.]
MVIGSSLLISIVCLILGLAAGFIMHRSDYCVAGMFRDAFLFKSSYMLRVLFLQVVVTMFLFEGARLSGLLAFYPFPMLGFPSLANLIGGFLFGIGMVMAGGCVVGTLYKMGAGSLASGLAFVGLVVGSGIYAEFHPWWASFIKATTFLKGSRTLPQLTNTSPTIYVAVIGAISIFFIMKWHNENMWQRASQVRGYLQPWKAAISLAVIGLVSYIMVGMPLGITTAYSKMAAMIENFFIPDHVKQVAYFQVTKALDIVHPTSGALMQGGPGAHFDTIWAIQFPLISGIVLGSMVSAILLREFAVHFKVPPVQLITAFTGGVILGMASRMAPACNVWHIMGGLPLFAMHSLIFIVGLVPGAYVGSRIVSRIILGKSSGSEEY